MWKELFTSFQLPIFLSKSMYDEDTKQSIILLFGFFIVESIQRTNPEFVLETLKSEFALMDADQIKKILIPVISYLNNHKMLTQTLINVLHEDCLSLFYNNLILKSKATTIYFPLCNICQNPITGSGGIGAIIFNCGHCFHNNSICGGHQSCPTCRGESKSIEKNISKKNNNKNRLKQRLLQRVEFGLKNLNENYIGNNIYFLTQYPIINTKKRILNIPELLPDPKKIFLEI